MLTSSMTTFNLCPFWDLPTMISGSEQLRIRIQFNYRFSSSKFLQQYWGLLHHTCSIRIKNHRPTWPTPRAHCNISTPITTFAKVAYPCPRLSLPTSFNNLDFDCHSVGVWIHTWLKRKNRQSVWMVFFSSFQHIFLLYFFLFYFSSCLVPSICGWCLLALDGVEWSEIAVSMLQNSRV